MASLRSTPAQPALAPCERCHAWVRREADPKGPVLCAPCAKVASTNGHPFHSQQAAPSPARPEPVPVPTVSPWQHWSQVHSPWPRLPVLMLLLYWSVRSIFDPEYISLFGGINLGIHEIGHVVFSGFGPLLHSAGGTLLQCAAPLAAGIVLWRQQDWFGLAFAGTWLGTNLHGVAWYMADARARLLPLLSLGNGEPQHDWEYMLGRFGLLQQDLFLAGCLRTLAALVFLASVGWGAWVIWNLFQHARPSRTQ